eukprot:1043504-Pyramimonas_sp.AAC.1
MCTRVYSCGFACVSARARVFVLVRACVRATIGATQSPNSRSPNTKVPTRSPTAATAPIAEGEREYSRSRRQSQQGRENIPVAGANRSRGERICPSAQQLDPTRVL